MSFLRREYLAKVFSFPYLFFEMGLARKREKATSCINEVGGDNVQTRKSKQKLSFPPKPVSFHHEMAAESEEQLICNDEVCFIHIGEWTMVS